MAWKIPKHRWEADQVVDLEAFNGNMLEYSVEFGRLNEHNWNERLAGDLDIVDDLSEDVAWSVAQAAQECDVGGPTYSSTIFELEPTQTWVPVDDAALTVETDGSPVLVYFTGQYVQNNNASDIYMGARFGIEVDGALITESCTGVLDGTSGGEGAELGYAGDSMGFDCEVVLPLAPGSHVIRGVARLDALNYARLPDPDTSLLGGAVGHRELFVWELAR